VKVAPDSSPEDFHAESLFDVDFPRLRDLGVRGVLLDVDNTLVRPRSDRIERSLADHLVRQRNALGFERWALASNARRDLSNVASTIGAEIVSPGWFAAKPRELYFRRALAQLDMDPAEVAMIGDKVLHDIRPATRIGIHTVLVRPQWPDQLVDRLFMRRRREGRLARRA
jgi:uncharacterized protein